MENKRHIYLHDIPLDEAMAALEAALERLGQWRALPGEEIPVTDALGRITSAPVWARISSPHYHASAMDGFAVRSRDTVGATETRPLRISMIWDAATPEAPAALPVNTGHAMPSWADAVIMVEHAQLLDVDALPVSQLEGAAAIEIRSPVSPWQHVRAMGEDMVATELVLPANHQIRPVDMGAILGSGHSRVLVRRKPRVAIIPTGSELVRADENTPEPGQIIEYNSVVLAAQVSGWGGTATRWSSVPDDLGSIGAAVADAAEHHDLILVNAGSSAGTEDYTASVVQHLGDLLVHGVAVRPGHPVIIGVVDSTLVIGVPGYPVSAALTGDIFVGPVLARWLGQPPPRRHPMRAVLTRPVLSPMGDDEFLRVAVGRVGSRTVATPLSRGAGAITSLVRADGIVRIPRFSEGFGAGQEVTVHLLRSPEEITGTIVAIGSHDLALDLLAQHLAERSPTCRLSSTNVGSVGGLLALGRNEAHLAGSHLMDPESGEYNVSYVKRYLPGREVRLITLVEREQGLIVQPGNPLDLAIWDDLRAPGVRYVNRQRGAGTRILLDYNLDRLGIMQEEIVGYQRQEYTHLAVAAAVASGVADCGLGIRAAAEALGLGFVPLVLEQYDLVIPTEHATGHLLAPLLELLGDQSFREAVQMVPGYHVSKMGQSRDALP